MRNFRLICEICGKEANGHLKHDYPADLGFRTYDWSQWRYENRDAENNVCYGICEPCAEMGSAGLPDCREIILDPYNTIIKRGYRWVTIECDCERVYEGQYKKVLVPLDGKEFKPCYALFLPHSVSKDSFPEKDWKKQYKKGRRVYIGKCHGCLEDEQQDNQKDDYEGRPYGAGIKGRPDSWEKFPCEEEAYDYARQLKGRSRKIEVLITYTDKNEYRLETFTLRRR